MTPSDRSLRIWLETLQHAQECIREDLDRVALLELRFLEMAVALEISCREMEGEKQKAEAEVAGMERTH